MKKFFYCCTAGLLVISLIFFSCSKEKKSSAKILVGVSMPQKDLPRWNQDGENMKKQLEADGYDVDLEYSEADGVGKQIDQIENMIVRGAKILVIAAISGTSLTDVLNEAGSQGIPVIAYDRLIMNSKYVNYYATFDNDKIGEMQGDFIINVLGLDSKPGPFNIEMFTGDTKDNNIVYFFGGAKRKLQPYLDSGKLKVLSGQISQAQCATDGWLSENAQKRMENLIQTEGYGPKGKKLDVILSSNDTVAYGVTNALVEAGYTGANFPLLTGQDCDKPNVKNMIAGTQAMSIFKDTRKLASVVVGIANAILQGEEPEVNDTTTYDNGVKVVPTYVCTPVVVTAKDYPYANGKGTYPNNYKQVLIDSGYYTEADIK